MNGVDVLGHEVSEYFAKFSENKLNDIENITRVSPGLNPININSLV